MQERRQCAGERTGRILPQQDDEQDEIRAQHDDYDLDEALFHNIS
jgi:hypothetical protein